MIKVGSLQATDFKAAGLQVAQINVGSGKAWPAGITYTLELKSVTYSSASNTVHATGSDYVEFSCYYKKYRYGTLIQTDTVTAVPTSTYFETYFDRLYFDYDNHKDTTVSASSAMTATLSYGAAPAITGTFSFAGNTSRNVSTISSIVLSSGDTVGASGGTLTYTGGVVTNKRVWSSGYEEQLGTSNVNFSQPAYNSISSGVTGYINGYGREIVIPSLTNNQQGQSTYTFTSDSYNGTTVQVVITQSANSMHQSTQYSVWDPDNNVAYSANINVPASPAGYVKFQVRKVTTTTYDSGYASTPSTSTVYHSDYTYNNIPYSNGGCVTNIGWWDSLYTLQANYSANTGGTLRISGIIIVANDNSFNTALIVNQPAA